MSGMVALPVVEVEIDGLKYEIRTLDATKGFPLYCKLFNKAGEVMSGAGKLDGSGTDLALGMLGKALQALSPELVAELIKVFGATSFVTLENGKQKVGDVFMFHFAGKYGHMMSWLFACAKANFADFLPQDLISQIPADLLARFHGQSPTASSGSPTES